MPRATERNSELLSNNLQLEGNLLDNSTDYTASYPRR
jgi:hypothetical protein